MTANMKIVLLTKVSNWTKINDNINNIFCRLATIMMC